jgi:hypothetical protein
VHGMHSPKPTHTPALAALRALAFRYKTDGVPHEAQGVSPMPDTTRVKVDTLAGAPAGGGLRHGTHFVSLFFVARDTLCILHVVDCVIFTSS